MRRDVFALLCVSVWINYMDRGNLSVAAPALQPEMALSPTQMGVLLSGFFWTYSLLQPVAGWLVDRYNVYRLYAAGFAIWSLAVAAGGLAVGFHWLLMTRLLLGVGESLAYPAYSRMLTAAFPEGRRGFANAMIDVGTKAGPALGTLLGGMVIQAHGWRAFFFWMGGLSLVWLLPWLRAIPRHFAVVHVAGSAPSSQAILRRPAAWITFLGLFCFNYAYYFLLTWLPSYLVSERKFSLRAMAVYGALPFCATALASLLTGAWTDRRIRVGSGPELRIRVAVTGLLACAAMLLACATLQAAPAAMTCLVVGFVGIGLFTANAWAITQTMAGKEAAGTWTGWQNAIGNMGGVVAPIVTGWTVGASGSFLTAFAVASAMLVGSALLYSLLLRSRPSPSGAQV
ncbi:MAG: MFS transporter [Acidobacteria bacterium]|nr:MFS transporter [Acidobacteriota bacterium]MBI3473424.1 MFS transporter [Candidatus Solibacter usitatus]